MKVFQTVRRFRLLAVAGVGFLICTGMPGKARYRGAISRKFSEARCQSASHYTMSGGIVRTGWSGRFS